MNFYDQLYIVSVYGKICLLKLLIFQRFLGVATFRSDKKFALFSELILPEDYFLSTSQSNVYFVESLQRTHLFQETQLWDRNGIELINTKKFS